MNSIIDIIENLVKDGFEAAGYSRNYGAVEWSNRPDLCDVQCNGALAAAKEYHKSPLSIATDIIPHISVNKEIEKVEVAPPGFINIVLSCEYISSYVNQLTDNIDCTMKEIGEGDTIVIDYGGPNIAKPLHIGHLRPAIIGESIKRIKKYCGYNVVGDVHLGDWGYQMGLVIEALKEKYPDLTAENFEAKGIDVSLLETVYPYASAKAKEDSDFADKAHHATFLLQNKDPEYYSIWKKISKISIEDLKQNYSKLNVDFDLWYGESDAQEYIQPLIDKLEEKGCTYLDDGALVVDVQQEDDKISIPPCIIVKRDGAYLYSTTDLATILQRDIDFSPSQIIYVVDKRQELHFVQVFRCAEKAQLVRDDTKLTFVGFGTMNGDDGKPFKTRDGGVMRLEELLKTAYDSVESRFSGDQIAAEEKKDIISKIALAAIKYGDLSNQASKNYVFNIDRFCEFEGNTGPYILYTAVRIKSLLKKCNVFENYEKYSEIKACNSTYERELQLKIARFFDYVCQACAENAPHKICQYIYEVANVFNSFYHSESIVYEADEEKKLNSIAVVVSTLKVLEKGLDLLGLVAPDKM